MSYLGDWRRSLRDKRHYREWAERLMGKEGEDVFLADPDLGVREEAARAIFHTLGSHTPDCCDYFSRPHLPGEQVEIPQGLTRHLR